MTMRVRCPYCGERVELALDPDGGDADCIEDCPVCCRPIELRIDASGAGDTFTAERDDDA